MERTVTVTIIVKTNASNDQIQEMVNEAVVQIEEPNEDLVSEGVETRIVTNSWTTF